MAHTEYYDISIAGRAVKVNRGGPDSAEGIVIYVDHDYFALQLPKGEVVYFNSQHVKSISNLPKAPFRARQVPIVRAHNFHMLLWMLQGKTIQVNRGGPEKIRGNLLHVTPHDLILRAGPEFVRIPISHVKSVNLAPGGKKH